MLPSSISRRAVPMAGVALALAVGAGVLASTVLDDPLLPTQWHLKDRVTEVSGANVEATWPVTEGAGVVIGIVDDGLQTTHPDLAPNYSAPLSFDFNDADADPTPVGDDAHGTASGGVAAARGNNAIGGAGAAPQATLAGLRLLGAPATDADEAAALGHQNDAIHISSNSWGPSDNGMTLGRPGPLSVAARESAILTGRQGKGRIFVFAAGNGRASQDNCNFDGYANSRYAIAVGAINDLGNQSSYSESCSALMIAAPSNGGTRGITTTDITGAAGYTATDYTTTFGGTSSAAPLVSGAVALMLARNANLTWRDVQHILRRTSVRVQPGTGWTNGVFPHNEAYGFGLLDATAAATMAAGWVNVPAEVALAPVTRTPALAVPDNNTTGVADAITIPGTEADFLVEHIQVDFTATHPYRGDLHVTLTSPSGTVSTLATVRTPDSGDNFTGWSFGSVRHWGESAAGTWTLRVSDRAAPDIGTFNSWTLRIFGYRVADGPPAAFTKSAPANGATNQSIDPVLSWTAATGATGYEYCIDTVNDGVCMNWVPVGNMLLATPGPLAAGTTYFWHVRATSAGGLQRFADGSATAFHSFSTPAAAGQAIYDATLKAPRCSGASGECDSGPTLLQGRDTLPTGPEPNQPNTIANSCADGVAGIFHSDESIDRLRVTTLDGSPLAVGKTVRVEATIFPFEDGQDDRLDIYYAPNANTPVWTHVATLAPSTSGLHVLTTTYVLPAGALQAIRAVLRYGPMDPPLSCALGDFNDHDDLVFPVGAAAGPELVQNGSFSSGITGWEVFEPPNIVHNSAAGGEFRYHRNPMVTGSGQAVIFQRTGVAVPTGTPLTAVFDIGNLDVVRKRISVLIIDDGFSDITVCTYFLAAGAPMRTYRMTTHTTKAWTNASIYFYTASPGAGDYRLDNVSLRTEPAASAVQTECDDPTAPPTPGGASGPNLLTNGNFAAGMTGWSQFHDLTSQLTAGVFEFLRPGTPGIPAGGILQSAGQGMNAGEILTATFSLGNSSAVRKRVTILIHDLSYADLTACTLWLAPFQPLSPYAIRTFASQAWGNATFSIFAASVGPESWTRLDDVVLRRTPGLPAIGTQCFEPGAPGS